MFSRNLCGIVYVDSKNKKLSLKYVDKAKVLCYYTKRLKTNAEDSRCDQTVA